MTALSNSFMADLRASSSSMRASRRARSVLFSYPSAIARSRALSSSSALLSAFSSPSRRAISSRNALQKALVTPSYCSSRAFSTWLCSRSAANFALTRLTKPSPYFSKLKSRETSFSRSDRADLTNCANSPCGSAIHFSKSRCSSPTIRNSSALLSCTPSESAASISPFRS